MLLDLIQSESKTYSFSPYYFVTMKTDKNIIAIYSVYSENSSKLIIDKFDSFMNPSSKWIFDFTQTFDSFIVVDDTQNQTIYDYVS